MERTAGWSLYAILVIDDAQVCLSVHHVCAKYLVI